MERYTLIAEKEDTGRRIDVFVSDNMDSLSRSMVQKLIESGDILVNEKKQKSNYKLRCGDIISAIWTCVGYTVLLCFTLFKTSSLSKSVFNAH